MSAATSLGRFEFLVLAATLRLGDRAYAVPIREEIARRTGTDPSRGALYTALTRLEAKGLLVSEMGEPTAVRGGKAKRYYRPTNAGVAALRVARSQVVAVWASVTRLIDDAP